MRLGSPIQYSPSWSVGLFAHQLHLQPLFAKAFALTSHRGSADLEGLRDPLVGPAVGSIGIGLQEDASIELLTRMSLAVAYKPFGLLSLFIGKADDVSLVHVEYLHWLGIDESTRSRSTAQLSCDRELGDTLAANAGASEVTVLGGDLALCRAQLACRRTSHLARTSSP